MDKDKAVGIDGVTKEAYGNNLDENLNALVERLKRKEYKPKPAKRIEIRKDNGKMRPLSIYCLKTKWYRRPSDVYLKRCLSRTSTML